MQLEISFLLEAYLKNWEREKLVIAGRITFYPTCCHHVLRIVSPVTLFCSISAVVTSRSKIF